jgi:hypothetical protein
MNLIGIAAKFLSDPNVPEELRVETVIKRFVSYAWEEHVRTEMEKVARPEIVARLFAPEDD